MRITSLIAITATLIGVITFITLIMIQTETVSAGNYALTSDGIKRIVVENLYHHKLPQNPSIWENENRKIEKILSQYDAEIEHTSTAYAYSKIKVPTENYDSLVNKLKEKKYGVHDEILAKPGLDESIPAMMGPYEWFEGSTHHILTGRNVIITIIDSGIDSSHKDFLGKILDKHDSFGVDSNVPDITGHGTHVAGIAAGTGEASDDKFKGVAPNANLKIARACHSVGCPIDKITDAINWAVESGTHIISFSNGVLNPPVEWCTGDPSSPSEVIELYEAIEDAIKKHNVMFVTISGNEGPLDNTLRFPGCMNDVITVGSTLKKNYGSSDHRIFYNIGGVEDSPETVEAHIEIKFIYPDGWESIEKYWEDDSKDWSGIQLVYSPGVWPITVEVKIDGESKHRECYHSEDTPTWNSWNYSYSLSSGPYIAVEAFVKPEYTHGGCFLDPGGDWYDNNYQSENSRFVNVFTTPVFSTKDLVPPSSSRGPLGTIKPDFVAPGAVTICATHATGTGDSEDMICGNDNYIAMSGTSMAASHVSGVIALLKEANPKASPDEIFQSLLKADDVHGYPVNVEGHGRINIRRAADAVGECHLEYPSVSLDLPSSVSPGHTVTASVYGQECYFVDAELRKDSCDGDLIGTCKLMDSNCDLNFNAPSSAGTYIYYACVRDVNNGRTLIASDTMAIYTSGSGGGGGGGGCYGGWIPCALR